MSKSFSPATKIMSNYPNVHRPKNLKVKLAGTGISLFHHRYSKPHDQWTVDVDVDMGPEVERQNKSAKRDARDAQKDAIKANGYNR